MPASTTRASASPSATWVTSLEGLDGPVDAICLDVDNGPGWLVHDRNRRLYADAGIAVIHSRLRPGGRLTVWAAAADAGFEARLRDRFDAVRAVAIPVPRGEDDVVYVAESSSKRRGPPADT